MAYDHDLFTDSKEGEMVKMKKSRGRERRRKVNMEGKGNQRTLQRLYMTNQVYPLDFLLGYFN